MKTCSLQPGDKVWARYVDGIWYSGEVNTKQTSEKYDETDIVLRINFTEAHRRDITHPATPLHVTERKISNSLNHSSFKSYSTDDDDSDSVEEPHNYVTISDTDTNGSHSGIKSDASYEFASWEKHTRGEVDR